jgi:hypothetical protein
MLLSGLFLIARCKKNDPNGEKDIEYPIEIPFTEYALAETCQWTNFAYDNTVVIINSDEQLNQYVTCTGGSYSEIDFAKHTLLLATGKTNSGIPKITVTNLQQLSEKEYELNMEILLNDETVVEEWTVALIVEKVSRGSKVNVITAIVEFEFPLQSTTWKLVGFVDVETGEIKEIETKNYERCYRLTFNKDNTFTGFSFNHLFYGNYIFDEKNIIHPNIQGKSPLSSYGKI